MAKDEDNEKDKDLDGDGNVSPAERDYWKTLNPDPLTAAELAKKYGFALRVLRGNDELWKLFQKAVKGKTAGDQMTVDGFTAELQNSKWWRENSEYARKAWTAQKLGGADWKVSVQNAEQVVKTRALTYGLKPSKVQLRELALSYLYEGWEDPRRQGLMDAALAKYVGKPSMPGDVVLESDLRKLAWEYGVQVDDDYLDRIQKDILRGKTTEELAIQAIKDKAKSKYKPLATQIDNGETTRGAMSQYLESMSRYLELGGVEKIDLDDPLLRKALGTTDTEGKMVSAWDFEKMVRRDPRWAETKNGTQSYVRTAQDFIKSLGF